MINCEYLFVIILRENLLLAKHLPVLCFLFGFIFGILIITVVILAVDFGVGGDFVARDGFPGDG